jgi:hypothetical protein
MDGSGSGGGKEVGRFTESAHQVLTWLGRRRNGPGTATSALSMSCSDCSPRATAKPPRPCGRLGWS